MLNYTPVVELYSKPYKTYFGEDAIDKFLNDWMKESEYYSKVIETEFKKPFVMAEICHEDFTNSSKCWICKKAYEEVELKVKDYDHITGESTDQECDLNLSLSKKNPCCVS